MVDSLDVLLTLVRISRGKSRSFYKREIRRNYPRHNPFAKTAMEGKTND